ncbi:MAG TPA: GNAT family N-acetyltransferase [Usitatibacter sp.]|jgi:phosphinothricin acetyltransferase|nr:GNAT family N-acetyltransferase [Usitatibacter sp.]
MTIRHGTLADLPAIVDIYNASIPGRLATADTEPVTVEQRREWFAGFSPGQRPLWVYDVGGVAGWLGMRSFYGRPAYHGTVECAVYVSPAFRRSGIARRLLEHALGECPGLDIRTILAFVFAHNAPSVTLFERYGFERWGNLPRVAELDGAERDLLILGLRVA